MVTFLGQVPSKTKPNFSSTYVVGAIQENSVYVKTVQKNFVFIVKQVLSGDNEERAFHFHDV